MKNILNTNKLTDWKKIITNINQIKDLKLLMFKNAIEDKLNELTNYVISGYDDVILTIKFNDLIITCNNDTKKYEIHYIYHSSKIRLMFATEDINNFLEVFNLIYNKKIIIFLHDKEEIYEKDICYITQYDNWETIIYNDIILKFIIEEDNYIKML
jgi:hypothetical protein